MRRKRPIQATMPAAARSLPRSTVLAALVTAMLVVGLAVLSYVAVDAFIHESREVSLSQEHLTELTALMSALEDAEDANRGFVLTTQDDYLKQYEAALAHESVHYDRLLASLSPEQRERLISLSSVIDARLDRLRQGIALAVTDREHARAFIEAGEGKELMDRIHVGVRDLQDAERTTVARRESDFNALAHLVRAIDLIGGILAITIVMGSTWAISWHWNRRLDAERSLRVANAHLESDVAQRTAALAEVNGRLQVQAKDLARSNQELESFSYSVSHDLRAPLRVIEGLSGILMRKSGDRLDEHGRSTVELMVGTTRRMRDLIDDLLAFSKLGFQEIRQERVDMDKLVADAWATCSTDIGERSVRFDIDPLPPCRGDPSLLRQVAINLLSNALKYSRTKAKSVIHMHAQTAEGLVTYHVTDNGVGFDMSAVGKLFGVFQRLHGESEFEGTGIGLAICRRIVERHGGSIWAESVLDERTTFHFTVPIWEERNPIP